ncbi:hypothetical protein [Spirosoma pulveris]
MAIVFEGITERKRQEMNLAFLAEVSQDLVGLTDIDETMTSLGAKIGNHFGLSRCLFVEIDDVQEVCRGQLRLGPGRRCGDSRPQPDCRLYQSRVSACLAGRVNGRD